MFRCTLGEAAERPQDGRAALFHFPGVHKSPRADERGSGEPAGQERPANVPRAAGGRAGGGEAAAHGGAAQAASERSGSL